MLRKVGRLPGSSSEYSDHLSKVMIASKTSSPTWTHQNLPPLTLLPPQSLQLPSPSLTSAPFMMFPSVLWLGRTARKSISSSKQKRLHVDKTGFARHIQRGLYAEVLAISSNWLVLYL